MNFSGQFNGEIALFYHLSNASKSPSMQTISRTTYLATTELWSNKNSYCSHFISDTMKLYFVQSCCGCINILNGVKGIGCICGALAVLGLAQQCIIQNLAGIIIFAILILPNGLVFAGAQFKKKYLLLPWIGLYLFGALAILILGIIEALGGNGLLVWIFPILSCEYWSPIVHCGCSRILCW